MTSNGSLLALGAVGALALMSGARVGSRSRRQDLAERARALAERVEQARAECLLALLSFHGDPPPPPTSLIGAGNDACVFATTDPGVVVRVGYRYSARSQKLLLKEDFLHGAVKVLFTALTDDSIVTWKERLDTKVESFIFKRYAWDPVLGRYAPDSDEAQRLRRALLGLAWATDRELQDRLQTLSSFPETAGLARALLAGMPAGDLDLNHNLGVTRDGRIVAYDL